MKKINYFLYFFCILLLTNCSNNDPVIYYSDTKENNTFSKEGKDANGLRDYLRELRTPIGGVEMKYEPGYLWREFVKAKEYKQALLNQNSSSIEAFSAHSLALTWKQRGPANVPGRIRTIAIDPSNTDRWYIGSVGGGVWRTEDKGQTWTNLTDFKIPNLATSNVVLSAKNPAVIYAGTGEVYGNADAISGLGIMKSSDSGVNWTILNSTTIFGGIARLAVDPNNEKVIVASTETGIYKSSDGGATWIKPDSSSYDDLKAAPSNFNVMYAVTSSSSSGKTVSIKKSIDGGTTWKEVNTIKDINRIEIAISNQDPNRVYLSAYLNNYSESIYVSSDGGTTFNIVPEVSASPSSYSNFLGSQGWYDNVISVHPTNDHIIYVGGVSLLKMELNGEDTSKTSTVIFSGQGSFGKDFNRNVHVDQHVIEFIQGADNKFELVIGNDGGVALSKMSLDPGIKEGDFVYGTVVGMNNTQFYGAHKSKGINLYIAGAQDNGSWFSSPLANENSLFTFLRGGDGFECAWNAANPNLVMVSSQFNGVQSTDLSSGESFYMPSVFRSNSLAPFITRLAYNPAKPNRVFAFALDLALRTTDFGKTWIAATPNMDAAGAIGDIEVSLANPDIVWTSNAFGEGFTEDNMHISTDGGLSYNRNTGTDIPFPFPARITGIESHPTEPHTAFVLFSLPGKPKIIKTEDLGATWVELSGFGKNASSSNGFPDVKVYSLLVMPFNTNIIWVGTDLGIFESTNAGVTWTIIDKGLPAVAVWDMKVVDNQVVIATHGRGIWTATISELTLSTRENELANSNSITVYPNPTTDNIFINLKNSNNKQIKYDIFDISGRLLKTGIYSKSGIDVKTLKVGSYIIQSKMDGKSYSSKFIKK